MAKFNFRLQNYLGVKEKLEDQKEIEYGQALRRLEEERRKKMLLLAQREEQINTFRTSLMKVINPADIRRYNNVIERLKTRIKEQEQRISAAEVFAERKRLELVEAIKERKMLESIREKRFDEYTREELLAEQKQVDELVSYQYAERSSTDAPGG